MYVLIPWSSKEAQVFFLIRHVAETLGSCQEFSRRHGTLQNRLLFKHLESNFGICHIATCSVPRTVDIFKQFAPIKTLEEFSLGISFF